MTEIEYEGKKYRFSWYSAAIFFVLCPLIGFLSYEIVDNLWLYTHLPVIAQTVDFINFFHLMEPPITWDLGTGMQANSVFLGIILATPHSQDKIANKWIWPRKLLALGVSWVIFYVVNILRMVLQLTLYYNGAAWEDIHVSISAASSFIAVLIIILMHKWVPEFIIFVIWIIGEIKIHVFGIRKKTVNTLENRNQQIPDAQGQETKQETTQNSKSQD
jgi:exosortase/archaeosortase family protein